MKNQQARIVELQRQTKIAREALTKIASGNWQRAEQVAADALEKMWPLEPKQPLQGLCGHAPRRAHP